MERSGEEVFDLGKYHQYLRARARHGRGREAAARLGTSRLWDRDDMLSR